MLLGQASCLRWLCLGVLGAPERERDASAHCPVRVIELQLYGA